MAQRTVALCNGKYIGIETIYTVINGRQINIPEKLKELRAQSQRNELFCPCGCGTNLILVAEYSVAAGSSAIIRFCYFSYISILPLVTAYHNDHTSTFLSFLICC